MSIYTAPATSATIADGSIVDADVNATAAIAGTKVSPNFGSQTVQTTGVFSHALGTAAAPTVAFTGDPNTGIYSPGADQVAISTNGTGRLFISSTGLVGIGTSAPGSTLHIEAAGNTVEQRIFTSDNVLNATASLTFGTTPGARSKASIRLINSNTGNGSGDLALLTNDGSSLQNRLYITSAGNVGIGTSAPNYELQVNASDALSAIQLTNTSTGTTASDGFLIYNNGVNATISNEESGYLRFQTAGLERAQIDSSGRLLVGTSTNTGGALFQVNGDRIRVATAKTPASATDTGSAGEICWDANYIYVCTATNTWKRSAIATW